MIHTEFSLRRPVTICMMFAALAAVGLISSRLLPLEELPDIEWPGFFVNIPYEGSSPKETETQITRPAEEALATLPGVKNMYSNSSEDGASVWLEYGFNSNAQTAAVEARVKLDAVRDQMPGDLERIQVFSGSMNDQPIMQLRVSSQRNLENSYELLDRVVKRRLERIEGVSKVELQGVEPPEIRIRLDSGRIAAHDVDLNALSSLLMRSNFVISGGQITSGNERLTLRPNAEYQTIQDIEQLVIDGRNLRLADIANISKQPRDRDYGRHLDQKYAIGLSISRASGANMVEVADRVKEEVRKIGELPEMAGIQIFDLDNKADSVRQSLRDLVASGIFGALLAIVVLYFFLRHFVSTLIVTLSVPLSLIITLGAMYWFGLTLNILTLMGLMLAVGMLVDNSVVVTESIFRYRQMTPDDPIGATMKGVKEVGVAVMASTATSVCVFLPLVFGEQIDIMVFLRHVGITISVAIVCSLLVAQTLIPLLASRVKKIPVEEDGRLMKRVAERYQRILRWIVEARGFKRLAAPTIALLILASIPVNMGMGLMKVEMFPEEPTRRLFMPYNTNDIYSLEVLEDAVDTIETYLYENKERLEIDSVYSYWDRTRAESTILLRKDNVEKSSKEIMSMILDELPEIAVGQPAFERQNTGGGEGFSVVLSGESTDRLVGLMSDMYALLQNVEGLRDFRSDLTAGPREVQIRLDRTKAARYGLTASAVGEAVGVALRGERLREFRSENGEVEMRLAFRDNDRQSVAQLGNLVIPGISADGSRVAVPLYRIAELREERGSRNISRTNRRTSVQLSAALDGDATLEEVKPRVEKVLENLSMPAGYEWSFGRGFDRADETKNVLMENILLGVLLILVVMAALFESLLYPLSIMVSLLYSFAGVVWFLTFTGTPLTFMGMTGLMILIGVVVNNGIVLVDHINNLRREGMPRDEAILVGARDRLRPILMTAATTILGLTPLAFGDTQVGSGGPAYYPMARAIIGGLAFSTIVSLFVVPMAYAGLDKFKNWVSNIRRQAAPRSTVAS
ncbi:MAG: efflux RND transporter permease subunit [Pseudomonadota bacterium]